MNKVGTRVKGKSRVVINDLMIGDDQMGNNDIGSSTKGKSKAVDKPKFITPTLPDPTDKAKSKRPALMIPPQSELHFSHLSTLCPPAMLTLNPNTLFYWNLSDISKKHKFDSSSVLKWTESVQQSPTMHSRAGVSS